jgi:hypothetical protein
MIEGTRYALGQRDRGSGARHSDNHEGGTE